MSLVIINTKITEKRENVTCHQNIKQKTYIQTETWLFCLFGCFVDLTVIQTNSHWISFNGGVQAKTSAGRSHKSWNSIKHRETEDSFL